MCAPDDVDSEGSSADAPEPGSPIANLELAAKHANEEGDLPQALKLATEVEARSFDDDALVQPASRKAFADLLAQGWTDVLRRRHPDERIYTFWSYKRNRWARNGGLRLDHLLPSPELAGRVVDGGVDREVRGQANASDHAPAWVEIG